MKKFNKIISAFMTVILFAGISGCGEKSEDVDTLVWYIPSSELTDKAAVMEEINKITVPAIGAKVQFETIDFSSYGEKMRMKMASGDDSYDIMFVGYLSSYTEAVKNEVLEPLTDLINEYAPELKESIDEYIWEGAEYDGEIYAVPNVQIEATQYCYGIQTSLAEKYGWTKEEIESPEEIEEFLAKIAEGEPDIYPYRTNYGITMWTAPNYEDIAGGVAIPVNKDSKEAVILMETPEYQQGIKTLRDWYEKGYIRNDVASVGDDSTDFNANRYAVNSFTWKPGMGLQYPDYTFVKIGEPMLKNGSIQATMTGINYKSKNKEKAIQLIALMNTNKELYNLASIGIEGKHYTLNEDGKYSAIKDSGYGISAWVIGNQFNALINENQDATVWEETKKMNDESAKSPILGFRFDDSNIKTELSSISAISGEYSALSNGSRDYTEFWDEMISRYNSVGLQKVKDEVQKQLDNFFTSN